MSDIREAYSKDMRTVRESFSVYSSIFLMILLFQGIKDYLDIIKKAANIIDTALSHY